MRRTSRPPEVKGTSEAWLALAAFPALADLFKFKNDKKPRCFARLWSLAYWNYAMAHDQSVAPILIVESGLHRTARAALAAGRNRIGTTDDHDIVLSDLLSPGTPFWLEHCDGKVLLQAVDATIDLPGRKQLAPGQSKRCPDGLRFTGGGITFRLDMPGAAPAQRSGLMTYMPACIGAVLCLAMLTTVVRLDAAAPPKALDLASETTGSLPAPAGPNAPAVQPVRPAGAVLESLRQHLDGAGLESITLTTQPDASIEARGLIAPQQDGAWREAGRWFDTVAGGRAVLVDQVRVATEAPPLAVQAVWPGNSPYVIDGNGDKLFIGSLLASGWTISGIDAKRVLVKRGDQTLAVRF